MLPVYLDHQATTPLDPRVREAMSPHLGERVGNPDSRLHAGGRRAREAVEAARAEVALLAGVRDEEVVFTSGATEATALAMSALAASDRLVTGATEHSSVLAHARARGDEGAVVVPVDARGHLDLDALRKALRRRPRMVSAMLANNEIGTLTDLRAVATLVHEAGALFHVDAAQGVGLVPLGVGELAIDFASLSAHKLHGPMGTGALVVRKQARGAIHPLLLGGGQEFGLRSGTPNVPGIVGFGRAAALQRDEGTTDAARMAALRDDLARMLVTSGCFERNGDPERCHPGNLSVRARGISADRLALEVEDDVAFGTGSACSTGKGPSHVLAALGLDADAMRRTVRLGLGRFTRAEDVDHAGRVLVDAVRRLAT